MRNNEVKSGLDRRAFLAASASSITAVALCRNGQSEESKPRGLVVGQAEGAATGNAVLAQGGNAVDAAVAAALVAGVVAVPSTGIGGYGGSIVIATPEGNVSAIDFNSTAPAAAKPDMFGPEAVKARVNAHGWLAAGVPGVLAGLQMALDKFGSKPFAELVKPAIQFATDGFRVSAGLARAIKNAESRFAKDAGSSRLFIRNGKLLVEGDRFQNPDLGRMLAKLADSGRVDDFYHGDTSKKIAAAFQANGGLVTAEDLRSYRPIEIAPLTLDWQGHTILTPPPTSGGLTVVQALGILKALDWAKGDLNDPAAAHARLEALRIAWSDRLKFLGDPKKVDVPIERLLSQKYASQCADRVAAAVKSGKPVEAQTDGRPANGTIHLTAADANGMMVALTFTHGEAFGAQVTVDGLGLILGHGMSRFEPKPGHPNSPGPGKRPLHNMCPTIVLKDGKPILALGATGGRRIPNTLFDVLTYYVGERRLLSDAVAAPRMHTEGDLALTLEAKWPEAIVERCKKAGYRIKTGPGANLNAIVRDPKTGAFQFAQR